MFRLCFIVFLCTAGGCVHHQLRYNTTQQARTVADVHTQQVLDNLAKFAQNPDALPHFSFPQGGASSVTDKFGQAGPNFSFTPRALSSWSLGLSGSRGMQEAYTMVPLNDPRKLELMRCAYQRVIRGHCSCKAHGCPNCIYRFNKFYLGTERPGKTAELSWDNKPIYILYDIPVQDCQGAYEQGGIPYVRDTNDFNDTVYRVLDNREVCITKERAKQLAGENRFKPVYVDNDLSLHTKRTGKVTIDCIGSGWISVGDKNDFRKLGNCCPVGSYCGTTICVPQNHLDQLSKLTMVILDIALNDDAALPAPTKQVVAFLDSQGNIAANRAESVYKVTRDIGAAESISAVATPRASAALKAARDILQGLGVQGTELMDASTLLKKLDDKNSDIENLMQSLPADYLGNIKQLLQDQANGVPSNPDQELESYEESVNQSLQTPLQPTTPTPGTNILLEDLRLRTLTPNN